VECEIESDELSILHGANSFIKYFILQLAYELAVLQQRTVVRKIAENRIVTNVLFVVNAF
jgi:hypothetical protein